jgi:hypothetical protein
MYPGLADSDCWVAELRHHELVTEGLRQQAAAGASAETSPTRAMGTTLRRHAASLLAQAGRRLLDAQSVSGNSLGATPVPARRSVAI